MACSEAEDAGGLAPAKDDNEAARFFIRRTLPILDCVDYNFDEMFGEQDSPDIVNKVPGGRLYADAYGGSGPFSTVSGGDLSRDDLDSIVSGYSPKGYGVGIWANLKATAEQVRGVRWLYDVSPDGQGGEMIPLFEKEFTIDYSEVELDTRLLDMTVSSGGVEGTNDLNPDKMIPKNILADDGYEGDIEHYFTVTGWVPYNSKTFDLTLAVDTPLSLFVYTESGIAKTYYTLIVLK